MNKKIQFTKIHFVRIFLNSRFVKIFHISYFHLHKIRSSRILLLSQNIEYILYIHKFKWMHPSLSELTSYINIIGGNSLRLGVFQMKENKKSEG